MAKNYFFAALVMSALQRLRVQSDLLDRTAFEALQLVVCTKGPMYKKVVDTSLHPSTYFMEIQTRYRRPVLLARAALL